MTIHDFVNTLCQDYPSLIHYLGFHEEEEMDIENLNKIYEPHLELEKLLQGIKSGEYFQGKLSIDRNSNVDGRILS